MTVYKSWNIKFRHKSSKIHNAYLAMYRHFTHYYYKIKD